MDFWLFHIIWRYYSMYCVETGSPDNLSFPPAVYWTRWGEAICTVYSLVSFITVAIAAIEQRDHRHKASPLEKLSGLLMQVSSTHALMITVCYFLVKPEGKGSISEYSSFYSHVLNSVIAIIDIFMVATPRRFLQFWASSLYLICYSIVNFVFWWNLGIVVYKPMDWGWWLENQKIPEAVGLSFAMFFVVVPIFHGILYLITNLMIRLAGCCKKPHALSGSSQQQLLKNVEDA